MTEDLRIILFLVSASLLSNVLVLVLHRGLILAMRLSDFMSPEGISSRFMLLLIGVMPFLMWKVMGEESFAVQWSLTIPVYAKIGAVFFYFTGCLIYLEILSLLSRGYSIRILADLFDRGGSAEFQGLKSSYGGGLGIEGLLRKRIDTLAELRFLYFHDDRIGPLTFLGKTAGAMGSVIRRFLRLEVVG